MKKTLLFLILVSAGFLNPVSSQEYQDWKWLYPLPQGNQLNWVKVWDNNVYYAFGNAGTFMKTTNGGANWFFHHKASNIVTQNGVSANVISAYFFNQLTGFAAGVGGVTKTTNGGFSFETVSAFSTSSTWNDVYFVNSSTGFVTGNLAGFLGKTTDGGNTWNFISGIPNAGRKVFSPDGNTIIVLVNDIGPSGSRSVAYRTTDSGNNWITTILTGSNILEMEFCNSTTGFIGGNGYLFFTSNTGLTWTQITTPTNSIRAVKTYQDSDSIRTYLAGPSNGIYYSNNNGSNWSFIQYNDPLQLFSSQYDDLSRNNNTIVTVGRYGLINKSTNNGANWINFNFLLNDGTLHGVFAESGNGRVWVVGSQSTSSLGGGQILFSSNGGINWSTQFTYTEIIRKIKMVDLNNGFALTTNSIIKTTNGGINWNPISVPGQTSFSGLDFINTNTGWVCGSGKVSKTTDSGLNWAQITPPSTSLLREIDFTDELNGWIANGIGNFHYTSNGGQNWSTQITITNGIGGIKMLNSLTGYVITEFTLKKTTNSGSLWMDIPLPVNERLSALDWTDVNNGFIGGQNGYAIKTTNGGQSWQIINTNGGSLNQIFMNHPDSVFAVGNSILKYTNSLTNILSWQNNIPERFSLYQNYPNPFNPNTTIEFDLKNRAIVSIKVYDIAGRVVSTMIDALELNAGRLKYIFDGSNLSTGVYFYSLIINGNRMDTKKMMLVK